MKNTVIKIICMGCRKPLGEMPGGGVTGVSGGICRECWPVHFPGIPYPVEIDSGEEQEMKDAEL